MKKQKEKEEGKKVKRNFLKENKGITLIALVVTIVVLIILAVISINAVLGENGIIRRAEQTRILQSHGEVEEGIKLAYVDYEFEQMTGTTAKVGKETKLASEEVAIKLAVAGESFLDYLIRMGYTDSNGVVDVDALLGHNTGYGNGSGNSEVYKVEASEDGYDLNYYGKEGEKTELAVLGTSESTEEEPEQNGPYEDESIVPTDTKYFTFDYDETNRTARLTGVNEMYKDSGYYDDDGGPFQGYYFTGIKNEEGNYITNIVIPSKVFKDNIEYTVTEIASEAFAGNDLFQSEYIPNILSVIIPNTITSIGDRAFYNCNKLTNITIGNSVTSIGDDAFYGTAWLTNKRAENPLVIVNNILIDGKTATGDITIPDSVTSIGDYAFGSCSSLTEITIPDSVTSIGDSAFASCSSLTEITIPDGVTSIGDSAFYGTAWLTNKRTENPLVIVNNILIDGKTASGDIIIPEGVTSISAQAFSGCSNLVSVTIPSSVTSIGEDAFYQCNGLTTINYRGTEEQWNAIDTKLSGTINMNSNEVGILTEPETYEYTFKAGDNITAYVVENEQNSYDMIFVGTGEMYNNVNWDCSNIFSPVYDDCSGELSHKEYKIDIRDVKISEGITKIGAYAFYQNGIDSTTIPSTVTSIGKGAYSKKYYGTDNLETVKYGGTEEQWNAINIGYSNDKITSLIKLNFNYTGE